jgi:hypothetical protein
VRVRLYQYLKKFVIVALMRLSKNCARISNLQNVDYRIAVHRQGGNGEVFCYPDWQSVANRRIDRRSGQCG